jgi:hypothetical protein
MVRLRGFVTVFKHAGLVLGIALVGWSSAAIASDERTDGGLAGELAAAVQHWLETGLMSDPGSTGQTVDVVLPPMARLDLGLLVEPDRGGARGLRVIGVRPGGWGQRHGLEMSDLILAVGPADNVESAADRDSRLSAVGLREQLLALGVGTEIGLLVLRGGREIELTGPSPVRQLPAVRLVVGDSASGSDAAVRQPPAGCARLSAFPVPPLQLGLHEAAILSIDGVSVPTDRATSRVDPGFRTIVVGERVPPSFLAGTTRRGGDRETTREFSLWLEEGRTYLIGARLLPAATSRGRYWEPVVWRTLDEACR